MRAYSPLSSRAGTPRSPLTPRTLQAKAAWWLAMASLVLSAYAVIGNSFMSDWDNDAPRVNRVVMKSFLLTAEDSKLLYQSKPLLVAEEELTDNELGLLQRDQIQKELDALATMENSAEARAAIVRQITTEYTDSEEPSEETVKELKRKWSKYSISADEKELEDDWENEDALDYPDEQAELERELVTWDDLEEENEEAFDPIARDIPFIEDDYEDDDIQLVKPSDAAAVETKAWHTGRGHADDPRVAVENVDTLEQPRPGKNASFIDALATCKSLECLRDAHTRRREPGQYNFPHAILIGWQKSATTSLFAHLQRHPQVLASEVKEPEFFTVKCKDNPNACPRDQQAIYIEKTLQRDKIVKANGKVMSFEASTHYAMNGDLLAKGIAKEMPWVKIVTSIREPISRATSMLVHMADQEKDGCLVQPGADLYTCLTTASQLVGNNGVFNLLDSPHGNYSYELRHWLEAFPRGRVHVVQYEELVAEDRVSEDILHELKMFLGVDPGEPGPGPGGRILDKHNLRKDRLSPDGWPIKRDEYLKLVAMVKEDAEKVADLIEEYGIATADAWMSNWEQVWQENLSRCDDKGNCSILLS